MLAAFALKFVIAKMPREDPELRNVTQIANIFKQIVEGCAVATLIMVLRYFFASLGSFNKKLKQN